MERTDAVNSTKDLLKKLVKNQPSLSLSIKEKKELPKSGTRIKPKKSKK